MIVIPSEPVLLKGHVRGHFRKNGTLVRPYWRRAALFASKKHKGQRRKDGRTPYMNHPVTVAKILHDEAGIRDDVIIMAALLHDTIEDTDTTADELVAEFGQEVASVVLEVSDKKGLDKVERRRLQVEHAPTMSERAQAVKLADKIANMRDIIERPPNWKPRIKQAYYDHAAQVMGAMSKPHPILREIFSGQYNLGRKHFAG